MFTSRPSRKKIIVLTAVAALAAAAAQALPAHPQAPTLEQRFAMRAYYRGEQAIWTRASQSMLLLLVEGGLNADAVALRVEDTAAAALAPWQDKLDAQPVLVEHARLVSRRGLYRLAFDRDLPKALLLQLAARLAALDEVRQVYPVLTRMQGRVHAADRLVLMAAPGRLDAVLAKVEAALDARLIRRSTIEDTALLAVGARYAFDAVEASRALMQNGAPADVLAAEPDLYRELELRSTVNDPMFGEQWHLANGPSVPGQGDIRVTGAWDITKGDPQVVIAVFDTGTDMSHEDLVPNIVGGFDASTGDNDPSAECSASQDGRDRANSCPRQAPYRESHGTSVCGTAAGRGDNNLGTSGVCPLCSLMPVRFLGGEGMASGLSTAEAFRRGVDEGAWVINNSWGSGISRYFPLASAVDATFRYARFQGRDGLGTLILFAAGNDTADVAADAHASSRHTMAVAASTNLDDWAYYSNWGQQIDVAAPSNGGATSQDDYGIVTTDYSGSEGYSANNYTNDFGGTSAASPVTAGLAGLILSANPQLTADQVRVILTSTADKIRADQVDWQQVMGQDIEETFAYDARGHSVGFGWGRVNATRAVAAAQVPTLEGGLCGGACPTCNSDGRCELRCKKQSDCPDGSLCNGTRCEFPQPAPTDIGELCNSDCPYCLPGVDNEFNPVSICTDTCEADRDCPTGFDCRLIEPGGPRLCAVGDPTAGDPADVFSCYNSMIGGRLLVSSDSGQSYCSDVCFEEGDGACPFGFHCGFATCRCTQSYGQYCYEYTCSEVASERQSDWYFPQCFADEGFGSTCQGDEQCKLGDYCADDGSCRRDDRQGCTVCQSCSEDSDCGPRGICYDRDDGNGGRCLLGCDTDGTCPGDSVCRELSLRRGSANFCLSPGGSPSEGCDPSYQCEVACRDDVPCEGDLICEQGACVEPPQPEPSPQPKTEDPGCGCTASPSPTPGAWLFLAPLFVGLRWRRAR